MDSAVYVLTYRDYHGHGIFGAYATYREALSHVLHAFNWMSYCFGVDDDPRPFKPADGPDFHWHGRTVSIKTLVLGRSTVPWFEQQGYPCNQSGKPRGAYRLPVGGRV